jgi:hypothetical protein
MLLPVSGCIRLANGERWQFTEEFQEYFQFSWELGDLPLSIEGPRDSNKIRTTISWYRHHGLDLAGRGDKARTAIFTQQAYTYLSGEPGSYAQI